MHQIKTGFKLFFQSIIFTFKHAQLYLYIGAYFVIHHTINYLLFPSLNLDIQSLNEGITMTGDYKAGISSSFNTLFLLGILFNIVSFIFFYVLIIGITDYTSHLLHKQSETIMHSVKKGLSHLGSIFGYGILKLAFSLLSLIIAFAIYALVPGVVNFANNMTIPTLIKIMVGIAPFAIIYFIYEAITFYFFPAITLSEISFFDALHKSWRLVLKTFFAIITFLILWSILTALVALFIPVSINMPVKVMFGTSVATAIASIFSYTIFTVFKTILYEKANGTLPKQYDPEK